MTGPAPAGAAGPPAGRAPAPGRRGAVGRLVAPGPTDTVALRAGLGLLVLVTAVYLLVAEHTGYPLSMMLLPPLVTAAIGGPRPTLAVGVVAVTVSVVVSAGEPDVDGWDLTARLGIEVLGVGLGAAMAGVRQRRERALADAEVTRALHQAFAQGLVPQPHPPAAVAVTSRFRAGEERLRLGGDFLDLVTLPDGRAGFVIGDVSGHGPRAASFGVAMRAGWKGIAFADPGDPVGWLRDLEAAFFGDGRFDGFATVLAGALDPRSGRVVLANAGHCWPVHLSGQVRLLEMTPSPPLGLALPRPHTRAEVRLAPGEALLVYTDGLVENRRADRPGERWSERDLLAWLADRPTADLDALLEAFGAGGYADDVAVMRIGHR